MNRNQRKMRARAAAAVAALATGVIAAPGAAAAVTGCAVGDVLDTAFCVTGELLETDPFALLDDARERSDRLRAYGRELNDSNQQFYDEHREYDYPDRQAIFEAYVGDQVEDVAGDDAEKAEEEAAAAMAKAEQEAAAAKARADGAQSEAEHKSQEAVADADRQREEQTESDPDSPASRWTERTREDVAALVEEELPGGATSSPSSEGPSSEGPTDDGEPDETEADDLAATVEGVVDAVTTTVADVVAPIG